MAIPQLYTIFFLCSYGQEVVSNWRNMALLPKCIGRSPMCLLSQIELTKAGEEKEKNFPPSTDDVA